MKLSQPQEFVLFLLGTCYSHCSQRIKDPLQFELRKCDFITLAKQAGLVNKSARAMYRNLELLEKSRYLNYKNNLLSFTPKGRRHFLSVMKKVGPYIDLSNALNSKDVLKFAKRAQLHFKR